MIAIPETGIVHRIAHAQRRSYVAVHMALCVALIACTDHPTSGRARADMQAAVQLRLNTGVHAAPGAVVDASVTFTPTGSDLPVTVARDSLVVSTGETVAQLALVGDVAPCVAAAPTGGSCQLDLRVRLMRDGALLDESAQRLTVSANLRELSATPVQLYEVASIRISPSTITGFQSGDTLLLTATPLDRSEKAVTTRTTLWSVVSGGVSVRSSGVVVAVQPGAAIVRASIGGRAQDLTITVLPPLSVTVEPTNASADVLIDANIRLTFSENVNASSVTATTVSITRNGVVVPVTRSVVGRVVTITPAAPLSEFQTDYVIAVTPGVMSTLGSRLSSNVTANFRTIFWDPNYSYRLTNTSTGPGLSLDTDGGGQCTMATSGPSLGQAWFFLPIIGSGGYSTMHQVSVGIGQGIEGAAPPASCFMFTLATLFTGMQWRATSAAPFAPSAFYLQNLNFGSRNSLSTNAANPMMLPTANSASQFWTFTRLLRRP